MIYKLSLIFLLSFASLPLLAVAAEAISGEKVVTSLAGQGYDCSLRDLGDCKYSECLGKINGYSRPVLILVP